MREKDIFERTQDRLRRSTSIGLVLLLIGLLGLGYYFINSGRIKAAAEPYSGLSAQRGKLVDLELVWLDVAFAERDDPANWYHFAQAKDYSLLVLELRKAEHEAITNLIAADPKLSQLEAQPYRLQGVVKPTYLELKPYITSTFNEYQVEGEAALSPSDPRASYMIGVGQLPTAASWPLLLLIPGVIGLVLVATAYAGKRGMARSREALREALPDLYDMEKLEQDSQLIIPELNLLVYEPLLIGHGQTVEVIDLRQTGWLYAQHTRQQYVMVHHLVAHLLTKKVKHINLKGKTKAIDNSLQPLWDYLSQHHPDIQQGYAKEQRKLFKERMK